MRKERRGRDAETKDTAERVREGKREKWRKREGEIDRETKGQLSLHIPVWAECCLSWSLALLVQMFPVKGRGLLVCMNEILWLHIR